MTMEVEDSYYSQKFWPNKRVQSEKYKYIVKVVFERASMGVGICLHQHWVLTTKFYDDNDLLINDIHMYVLTWDSGKRRNGPGQIRNVSEIIVHPLLNTDSCNYNVVLLRLKSPFKSGNSVGLARYRYTYVPEMYETCLILAPYEEEILAKEIDLKPLDDCTDHPYYDLYKRCHINAETYCVMVEEPIYGAPIVCNQIVVGILPSDTDELHHLTAFHHMSAYEDWFDSHGLNILFTSRSARGLAHRLSKSSLSLVTFQIMLLSNFISNS